MTLIAAKTFDASKFGKTAWNIKQDNSCKWKYTIDYRSILPDHTFTSSEMSFLASPEDAYNPIVITFITETIPGLLSFTLEGGTDGVYKVSIILDVTAESFKDEKWFNVTITNEGLRDFTMTNSAFLLRNGTSSMTGPLNMGGNNILDCPNLIANFIKAKVYVTSINLTSPGATLDGETMSIGDIVVVDTSTTDNGVYIYNGDAVPMERVAISVADLIGTIISITRGTYKAQLLVPDANPTLTYGTAYINFKFVTYNHQL